jgi:hypothetical protein
MLPSAPPPTPAAAAGTHARPAPAQRSRTAVTRRRLAHMAALAEAWGALRVNARSRIIAAGCLPHALAVVAARAAIQTNAVHGSTVGGIRPHARSIHAVVQAICALASARTTVAAWVAPIATTPAVVLETTAPQGAPCLGTAAVAPQAAPAPTPVIVLELTVLGLAARSPAIAAAKSLNVILTPAAVAGTCATADA